MVISYSHIVNTEFNRQPNSDARQFTGLTGPHISILTHARVGAGNDLHHLSDLIGFQRNGSTTNCILNFL